MNNSNRGLENNNFSYYPEDLNFNVETQSFEQSSQKQSSSSQPQQQSPFQNMFGNLFNGSPEALSSLLNGNNNNILTTLLTGGMFGNSGQNNNAMSQVLNILNSQKKTKSSIDDKIEKVIDYNDTIEEL